MPKKTTTKKAPAKKTLKLGAVAKAPKASKYKLEIHVNDLEYVTFTNDLQEALTEFVASPEFPFAIKTRVFIKFSDGKLESVRTYHVPEARRVFRMISHKPDSLQLLAQRIVSDLA